MNRLGFSVLLTTLFASPALAESVADLDKWFRDGYGALYFENSWDRADEFAQYFTEEISYRTDEGVSVLDINDFVVDSLEVWRDEGWEGTDIAGLDTKLLNATTALFDIKWHDRNTDGSTSFECGWYIADKIDGQWLLSQYIVMECAE